MADAAQKDIQIMAEPTPNPNSLKFSLDIPFMEEGSAMIHSPEEAKGSPLAERLFALGQVQIVFALGNFVTVTKTGEADWRELAYRIGDAIREHVRSGEPAFSADAVISGPSTEVERKIVSVIDKIRPAVQQDGGDIIFISYDDGIVNVQMQGACSGCPSSTATLKGALEAQIKNAVPEVHSVVSM